MSDSDKEQLVSDMLADMCGLIGKTIALIPPEHDDERLSACAFVLDQINEVVKRMVSADRTEHQRRVRRIRLDLQRLSAIEDHVRCHVGAPSLIAKKRAEGTEALIEVVRSYLR